MTLKLITALLLESLTDARLTAEEGRFEDGFVMPFTMKLKSPFELPPLIVSKIKINLWPALEQVTFDKPVEAEQLTYPGS